MIEHGVASGSEVQVVAALHRERDRIAERAEHEIRPRPERNDRLPRYSRSLRRRYPPASVGLVLQGSGIACNKAAALAPEQRCIGFRQPTRICHEAGLREMDGAD